MVHLKIGEEQIIFQASSSICKLDGVEVRSSRARFIVHLCVLNGILFGRNSNLVSFVHNDVQRRF